jgi:hypothetical protein
MSGGLLVPGWRGLARHYAPSPFWSQRIVDDLSNEHAVCLALAAGVDRWPMPRIRRDG